MKFITNKNLHIMTTVILTMTVVGFTAMGIGEMTAPPVAKWAILLALSVFQSYITADYIKRLK